jgi:hypothetical protein
MTFRQVRTFFLFGVMGSVASADEFKVVSFSLSTTGTFSSGAPADLVFSGSKFSGQSNTDGSLILSDLGMFTLTRPGKGADVYHLNSDTFTLNVIFSGPLGIKEPTVFDATLQGTVNRNKGSVLIDFGPTRRFNFDTGSSSGGFDLTIDDITLQMPPHASTVSGALTGSITNAFDPPNAVPEPQAVVLLGTVILLIGSAFRHRLSRRS